MNSPNFGLFFRRYAPFDTFGIPSFKGDQRKSASVSIDATSRTWGYVKFNSNEILESSAGSSGTDDANLVLTFLDRHAVAEVSLSVERSKILGPGLISFSASTAGANPLIPKSPDIDTKVAIRVSWEGQSAIRFSGTVHGDDFPNVEVFVRSLPSGRSVLLLDGRTQRGQRVGPFSLYGSGKELASFNLSFPLDAGGDFRQSFLTCKPIDI